MPLINDYSGFAALSIIELLLVTLVKQGVLPKGEVETILEDAANTLRETSIDNNTPEFQAVVTQLANSIAVGVSRN